MNWDRWHAPTIQTHDTRFLVVCIPHGAVSEHDTWFDAVIGLYTHDGDYMGTQSMWESGGNSPAA